MLKLLAHIAVLAGVVLLARDQGFGIPATVTTAILGAVLVHVVYEKLFGSSNVVGIREDDPLMLEAFQEAKSRWPSFLRLYAERPQHSVVKFALQTSYGIENVWGDLISMNSDRAIVVIRTAPKGSVDGVDSPEREIPLADIVDWQVVFDDETLVGGYTQQAVFRIIERDAGSLPDRYARELARYRQVPEH
jgi:uncharacterized protein YegJ (DUF2314 family)